MKNIFLSLLTIFAVVGTATAQDAPVNRSLSVYFDAVSGMLTELPDFNEDTDTSRIFADNEFEIGAVYSQNFATVPWLSMYVKALVVMHQKAEYAPNDGTEGNNGQFLGINNGGYRIDPPKVALGINLGGYAVFAIDTKGVLAQENYYSIAMPGNAGAFTFGTVLEMFVVPIVEEPDADIRNYYVVDLFALTAQYGIDFAPGWNFWTKVAFRFSGNDDSGAEFFQDSFAIRWENQVTWSVTPKLYMYGRVRYHAKNLVTSQGLKDTLGATRKTQHDVSLLAGLGYSFDFSNN